jgi:hypothetical protein
MRAIAQANREKWKDVGAPVSAMTQLLAPSESKLFILISLKPHSDSMTAEGVAFADLTCWIQCFRGSGDNNTQLTLLVHVKYTSFVFTR